MTFTYPITIVDSNISINGDVTSNTTTGSSSNRMITHDISNQIAQGDLVFELNPQPVLETLIVSLDGIILKPGVDWSLSTNLLTLNFDSAIDLTSTLLAIYEEA
jgi:hypothetical protein